jgi:putative transposon-encoded protein
MRLFEKKHLLMFRYLKISMRVIELYKGKLKLSDGILGFLERTVTPFGCSAKVDCPKRFIGKRAYLIICDD